jgi:hypothetical protein
VLYISKNGDNTYLSSSYNYWNGIHTAGIVNIDVFCSWACRCYYRCGFHRERNCRATKQVQQRSNAHLPQYVVKYFHEHTCDAAIWDKEPQVAKAKRRSPAGSGTTSSAVFDDVATGGGGAACAGEGADAAVPKAETSDASDIEDW